MSITAMTLMTLSMILTPVFICALYEIGKNRQKNKENMDAKNSY